VPEADKPDPRCGVERPEEPVAAEGKVGPTDWAAYRDETGAVELEANKPDPRWGVERPEEEVAAELATGIVGPIRCVT
jgi:hypothetical protein